jgi:hypothetical protein
MKSANGAEKTLQYYWGDSLRQITFSHGTFLRHNGAQERSIIQLTDLHSYWLSLKVLSSEIDPAEIRLIR